ncbi:MAG: hypothetical protein ABI583_02820 [Betaproteobacteria bacterium]
MNKILPMLLGAVALAACTIANAQQAVAPKPKVYALISAVGDQFSFVTQKQSVGSNILDHYRREVIKVPNNALNVSILKGLDRAIEQRDPGSTRILATLNALEMEGVKPIDREKVAMQKLLAALEKMPQRLEWDTIVVVTPKFQYSGRKGMGTKLEGIGIYVQPITSATMTDDDGSEILGSDGEETITPDGAPGKRSTRFVAPYNYTQTWVFDAKTLKVLETSARYEFQRVYDQNATAIDVAKSIPLEKMAAILSNFIERSVARGVGESLPSIEIGEIKPVATGNSVAPKPKS